MDCNTAASSSALTYPSRCSRCAVSLIEDDTLTQRTSSRSTEETCSAVADSDVVRLTARANSTPRARSGFLRPAKHGMKDIISARPSGWSTGRMLRRQLHSASAAKPRAPSSKRYSPKPTHTVKRNSPHSSPAFGHTHDDRLVGAYRGRKRQEAGAGARRPTRRRSCFQATASNVVAAKMGRQRNGTFLASWSQNRTVRFRPHCGHSRTAGG